MHESISALSSYLQESIFVFLKRQLFLIGVTVALLIMGSVGLQILNLHESSFLILIVWGVLWSAIIGYFAIRKSTQVSMAHHIGDYAYHVCGSRRAGETK